MEACWHQNRIKNRCQLRKADFANNIVKQMILNDFSKLWGRSWHQKSIKNPSKTSSDHQSSEGIAGEPRTCCEEDVCRPCLSKDKKIDQLFQLVQSLQSEMNAMKNCFQQQQDQVIHSIREEPQEFARVVDDTVYKQGESSNQRVK